MTSIIISKDSHKTRATTATAVLRTVTYTLLIYCHGGTTHDIAAVIFITSIIIKKNSNSTRDTTAIAVLLTVTHTLFLCCSGDETHDIEIVILIKTLIVRLDNVESFYKVMFVYVHI